MVKLYIFENHDYMDEDPFYTWRIFKEKEVQQYLDQFSAWSGTVRIVEQCPITDVVYLKDGSSLTMTMIR